MATDAFHLLLRRSRYRRDKAKSNKIFITSAQLHTCSMTPRAVVMKGGGGLEEGSLRGGEGGEERQEESGRKRKRKRKGAGITGGGCGDGCYDCGDLRRYFPPYFG